MARMSTVDGTVLLTAMMGYMAMLRIEDEDCG